MKLVLIEKRPSLSQWGGELNKWTISVIVHQRQKQLWNYCQSCSMLSMFLEAQQVWTSSDWLLTHTHTHHAYKQRHMPSSRPHPELKSCQSHAHLLPQQLLLSKRCISLCFPSWVIITGQKYSTYLSQNIWWEQKKKKKNKLVNHTHKHCFFLYMESIFLLLLLVT